MNIKFIIADLSTNIFNNNKILDEDFIKNFPGSSWWIDIKKYCDTKNIELLTADVAINCLNKENFSSSIFISEMLTPWTKTLIEKGSYPFIIFSEESPIVAPKFYFQLDKATSIYKYTFLFEGFRKFIKNSKFHPLYWPNNDNSRKLVDLEWSKKQTLIMVASNKNKYQVNKGTSYYHIKLILKPVYFKLLWLLSRIFRKKDLYSLRYKAIKYFWKKGYFRLYGTGWGRGKLKKISRKIEVRAIDDKIGELGKYKFCLCFENYRYPSYITEKIFDCFFAGCIPIYYGAPDINKYIPNTCYIDFKEVGSFKKLEDLILNIDKKEADFYLNSINNFLSSNGFSKFTQGYMSSMVIDLINLENG